MKLKKEFADFYKEIRIDKESDALREKKRGFRKKYKIKPS